MTKPLIQIDNVIRKMTDEEYEDLLSKQPQNQAPTKQDLMAELAALTAKIQALE
jgi:hypothetical protein